MENKLIKNESESSSDDEIDDTLIDYELLKSNKFVIEKSNLSTRFLNGLRNYNLTYEEIINSNWKYAGGNRRHHLNYFCLCFGSVEYLPDYTDECVCGHYIEENCYITDGKDDFMVVGNCCIQKFIPLAGRTCELCDNPHQNRKKNRCNECREKICDKCDASHTNKTTKKCNKCSNFKSCKYCFVKIKKRDEVCEECYYHLIPCKTCNKIEKVFYSQVEGFNCCKCVTKLKKEEEEAREKEYEARHKAYQEQRKEREKQEEIKHQEHKIKIKQYQLELESKKVNCITCNNRCLIETKNKKCILCIEGFCNFCDKKLTNSKYKSCYNCNQENSIKCLDCDARVNPAFKRCFACNNKHKNKPTTPIETTPIASVCLIKPRKFIK